MQRGESGEVGSDARTLHSTHHRRTMVDHLSSRYRDAIPEQHAPAAARKDRSDRSDSPRIRAFEPRDMPNPRLVERDRLPVDPDIDPRQRAPIAQRELLGGLASHRMEELHHVPEPKLLLQLDHGAFDRRVRRRQLGQLVLVILESQPDVLRRHLDEPRVERLRRAEAKRQIVSGARGHVGALLERGAPDVVQRLRRERAIERAAHIAGPDLELDARRAEHTGRAHELQHVEVRIGQAEHPQLRAGLVSVERQMPTRRRNTPTPQPRDEAHRARRLARRCSIASASAASVSPSSSPSSTASTASAAHFTTV